ALPRIQRPRQGNPYLRRDAMSNGLARPDATRRTILRSIVLVRPLCAGLGEGPPPPDRGLLQSGGRAADQVSAAFIGTSSRARPMRRNLAVVAAAAVVLLVAAGCVTRDDTIGAINSDRSAAGVGSIQTADDLTTVAQNWADHLRDTNSFYHQDIAAV